ncbi:MAG: DNA polymerase III subunit gamma/tau [Eubacteriaceae bacterium]|nr:DNA polymerase III subunit gamma/tau [Eubacteriaceae bacterium]
MAYQVLYRRFRPRTFDEIVGQEHIIPVLKNEIKMGRISHAYLFSGPRGTGKTSAAKVFARAVNCTSPVDGEACGECPSCLAEESGAISNIIEIDAASNRGIDEIRQLRENVSFLPSNARYRVYIIDEVHMLTPEAFNALLKTLEEPPEHIIFIFATTEVHRILPTILSRCQRFDFRRVSDEAIVSRLQYVLGEVGASYEEDALRLIASEADGGLRDALSLTDKVLASSDGTVSLENVEKVLGTMGQELIFRLCEAVASSDPACAFTALNEAMEAGTDAEYIIDSLTEYFRSLMIYTNVASPRDMLFKSRDYFDSLKRSSVNVTNELLGSYMLELGKLRADSRTISNTRYLIETALLRLCDKERLTDYVSLTRRVDILESRLDAIASGAVRTAPAAEAVPLSSAPELTAQAPQQPRVSASPVPQQPPEAPAVPENDPDVMARLTEALRFSSKYLLNRERDILCSMVIDELKVAGYSGEDVYVYPTGNSKSMMDLFTESSGFEKLNRTVSSDLGRNVVFHLSEEPKKTKNAAASGAAKPKQTTKAQEAPAPVQDEAPYMPPSEADIPPIEAAEADVFAGEAPKSERSSLMESAAAILGELEEVED